MLPDWMLAPVGRALSLALAVLIVKTPRAKLLAVNSLLNVLLILYVILIIIETDIII
jgi:hypothetical protein